MSVIFWDSFPISVLVGTVLGFLAGLGIGGGSLLILWLTIVLNISPDIARGINLLFFIPSALAAGLLRWKQGSIPLGKIWPAILSGCAAAFVFSFLSLNMDTELLKKCFGTLLLITGLRELTFKEKK